MKLHLTSIYSTSYTYMSVNTKREMKRLEDQGGMLCMHSCMRGKMERQPCEQAFANTPPQSERRDKRHSDWSETR